MLISYISFK